MLDRDPDPARSRDHVLLSLLAERRLRAGQSAAMESLLEDLTSPPLERVGAMALDEFVSARERHALDAGAWLTPRDGRTPLVIVSVAHLGEGERALVLGLLLEQVLT